MKHLTLPLALACALTLAGCPADEKPAGENADSSPAAAAPTSPAAEGAATGAAAPAAGTDTNPAASLAEVNQAAGKDVKLGDRVRIETSKGTFTVVLFPEAAPKHVENFKTLVGQNFYEGTAFHRVIPGFVAQGGDPKSKTLPAGHPEIGTGGSEKNVPAEFDNGLKHLRGSLAMARSQDPDSASSQFYIAFRPLPNLDANYTVFGHVVEGMDVVDSINPTERDGAPVENLQTDKIIKATIVEAK